MVQFNYYRQIKKRRQPPGSERNGTRNKVDFKRLDNAVPQTAAAIWGANESASANESDWLSNQLAQ